MHVEHQRKVVSPGAITSVGWVDGVGSSPPSLPITCIGGCAWVRLLGFQSRLMKRALQPFSTRKR